MTNFFDSKPPSHLTDVEKMKWYEERRREERGTNLIVALFVVLLGAAILGATLLHAEWIYGDWRCAFAECRIVKVKPEK